MAAVRFGLLYTPGVGMQHLFGFSVDVLWHWREEAVIIAG